MTMQIDRVTGPDLLDAAYLGHPRDVAARAHEAGPLYWNEDRKAWFVTGYEEVVEALMDQRFSIAYNENKVDQLKGLSDEALDLRRQLYAGGMTHLNFACGRSLLIMDPPEHTPYRMMLQPFFGERESNRLQPVMEKIVNDLLDDWKGRETVEVMDAIAYRLPVLFFGPMLGIPEDIQASFIDYDAFTKTRNAKSALASIEDYRQAAAQGPIFEAKLKALIEAKRQCPARDILTTLMEGEIEGEKMPQERVLAMLYLLNTGSHSTTTALIGNAVYYFLKYGVWSRLREEPDLLPKALEEVLRLDPPAFYVGREAKESFDFFGQRIEKGETVLLFFNAANRDPRQFDDPDEFRLDRPPARHLAFGLGSHFCLGAPFARREAAIALGEMLKRYPDLELVGEPEMANAFGFSRLDVRLNAAA